MYREKGLCVSKYLIVFSPDTIQGRAHRYVQKGLKALNTGKQDWGKIPGGINFRGKRN